LGLTRLARLPFQDMDAEDVWYDTETVDTAVDSKAAFWGSAHGGSYGEDAEEVVSPVAGCAAAVGCAFGVLGFRLTF
jgi:hypothetical protein